MRKTSVHCAPIGEREIAKRSFKQDDKDPPHGVIAIANFRQLKYHKEKHTGTAMLGPLTLPEMVASLVEGEVLVAANGSSYVSGCINLTCFSITRIKIFGR